MSERHSLNFSKAQGAGNDFVLIDDRTLSFPKENTSLIKRLCHRQYGIGSDGLILLQPSSVADHRMVYFNADGGEVALCGNGLRCLAAFIFHLGDKRESLQIETMKAKIAVRRKPDGQIATRFSPPKFTKGPFPLSLSSGTREAFFVDCGAPHTIFFSEDLDQEEIESFGKEVRNHPEFAPEGTNVTLLKCETKNFTRIRTYERGVEAETLACGTAALSAAKVLAHTKQVDRVVIYPASNEPLEIDTATWELTGPAKIVFDGIFLL